MRAHLPLEGVGQEVHPVDEDAAAVELLRISLQEYNRG